MSAGQENRPTKKWKPEVHTHVPQPPAPEHDIERLAHDDTMPSGQENRCPTCRVCGGPLREMHPGIGIWLHDNSDGWYAGRQMDHNAETEDADADAR